MFLYYHGGRIMNVWPNIYRGCLYQYHMYPVDTLFVCSILLMGAFRFKRNSHDNSMSVCLSVCLTVCLSVLLSVCRMVRLSTVTNCWIRIMGLFVMFLVSMEHFLSGSHAIFLYDSTFFSASICVWKTVTYYVSHIWGFLTPLVRYSHCILITFWSGFLYLPPPSIADIICDFPGVSRKVKKMSEALG